MASTYISLPSQPNKKAEKKIEEKKRLKKLGCGATFGYPLSDSRPWCGVILPQYANGHLFYSRLCSILR
jgi:hypothetical protein